MKPMLLLGIPILLVAVAGCETTEKVVFKGPTRTVKLQITGESDYTASWESHGDLVAFNGTAPDKRFLAGKGTSIFTLEFTDAEGCVDLKVVETGETFRGCAMTFRWEISV